MIAPPQIIGRKNKSIFSHGVFLIFLCAALLRKIDDFDIWCHLSIGREIVSSYQIPKVELFVLPLLGQPVSYHEWGFGVLCYLTYHLMNYWGLSLLNALFGGGTLFLMYRAARREETVSPAPLLVLGCLFWAIEYRFIYRPEMVLFFLLAAEIYLCERFIHEGNLNVLLPLPFFACLLSNFHPSSLFLMVVFGFYSLQFLQETQAGMKRSRLSLALLALLMCVFFGASLNPYGIRQVLLPLQFAMQSTMLQGNVEFLPTFRTVYRWHYILLCAVAVISLCCAPKRRLVDMLLCSFFAWLGYRYVRNVALFAIVCYVPVSRTFSFYAENRGMRNALLRHIILWVASLSVLSLMLVSPLVKGVWGAGFISDVLPVKSAEAITRMRPGGNVFNFYHMGGFLSWELYPGYRVFIDGRHYDLDRSLVLHNTVLSGDPKWGRILEEYGITMIVIPATLPFSNKLIPLIPILAEDNMWNLVGREPGGLLFLRENARIEGDIARPLDKEEIWKQVISESRKTLQRDPNNAGSYYAIGEGYMMMGDYANALEAFRNCLWLRPEDAAAKQMISILQQH